MPPFVRFPLHLLGYFPCCEAEAEKQINAVAAKGGYQRSRRSHKDPFRRIGILLWRAIVGFLLCCCSAFFVIVMSAVVMTRANDLGRRCHGGTGEAGKLDRPRVLTTFTKTKEGEPTLLTVYSEKFIMHRSLTENRGREFMVGLQKTEAEEPIIMGETMKQKNRDGSSKSMKTEIAMVTCTDGGERVRGRSFAGLMEMVAPNKQSYAERHGYRFIDASDLLDRSRPPSWSKILAVRHHLPLFQWVFWNDADSVVTNPDIRLEDILISVSGTSNYSEMPDFIVTSDVTGVNAGMFFFRNTQWSMGFLDLWWNQTSFIREMGQMKSGDNDALKYLLARMPEEEFRKHVTVPPMQCAFNSYPWGLSLKNVYRMIVSPESMWRGVYSTGDFMVHLAGLNEKKASIQRILSQIQYSTERHT